MTHTVFINTQAFGDIIFGINAARRYKKDNPDHLVSYCITSTFTLTTNEGASGHSEVLEVLEKQDWLDAVGVVSFDSSGRMQNIRINNDDAKFKTVDSVVVHGRWFSDLGISKSANFEIKDRLSEESLNDTSLQLVVDGDKLDDDIVRIGIAGPLDWNRKLQSEILRLDVLKGIQDLMSEYALRYEITMFGVEMSNYSLHQSLQLLKRQDLFVSPMGSLIHASAALDVDTVSISSIFPKEYDSPEFYAQRGIHKTVVAKAENHCESYACVVEKNSTGANSSEPGNPTAQLGFWPRHCPHTQSKFSCTKTYEKDQILSKVKEWLNEKYK